MPTFKLCVGLFFLCLLNILPAAQAALSGTISQGSLELSTNLSILVVSAKGQVIENVPVIDQSKFSLQVLPTCDGLHLIYLIGSTIYEYNAIVTNITSGSLTAAYARTDLLAVPTGTNFADEPLQLHFRPKKRTTFHIPPSGWRFPNPLRYKQRLVLGLAVIFILWFPGMYRKLPKELREELTGEKEPDLGDPNRVVKALIGEESVVRVQQAGAASTSR